MRLVFVAFCLIFVIINGFEYGIDEIRRRCWFDTFYGGHTGRNEYVFVKDLHNYTSWVKHCPYENRIGIHCLNGKIPPNATFEIWDNDLWPFPDDFVAKFNLTSVEPNGKNGYFDVYVPTAYFDDYGNTVDLYGVFYNPCEGVGKFETGDLMRSHFFPD
uniref:Uncharacterized protein n=1 Tax=Panagrolaimus sp. JU765 TaxID=591449 RepID=A0AC34PXF8_9BILA